MVTLFFLISGGSYTDTLRLVKQPIKTVVMGGAGEVQACFV